MKLKIREFIRKNGLISAIYIILLIIIVNSLLIFYYRNVIIENANSKELILQANHGIEFMNKYVNLADMGLRGYIIDQDDKFLPPLNEAMRDYKNNLNDLRKVLETQGFDVSHMDPAINAIDRYMELLRQMVGMCRIGNVDEAIDILKADPGYDAWSIYSVFEQEAMEFESNMLASTNREYNNMIIQMVIAQVILLIISGPILIVFARNFRKGMKNRASLFKNLNESNKKYIFDSGEEKDIQNEEEMIENLVSNLRQASSFINNITQGNYEIAWEGMNEKNTSLNQQNIAGELITMRSQMKKVRTEAETRLWITEGLSNFSEIIRSNQNDFKKLSEELISNMVKYLKIQQGGLFILNDENQDEPYLELMGCFAYDRVKSLEKKIKIGQGLAGQCFLEKETIYMTKVSQDFVNITSGLGDTRPDCILIVPLKLNDNIEGIVELASLKPFKEHEIELVEKLGETIASAITTVRTAENTKILLEQSQQQAEEMRAQEEEMRQNMEELQATQEQMQRKNDEIEQLLKKASENEDAIKRQNKIMMEEKKALQTEDAILSTLMQIITDRVTIKDKNGKYLKVSQSKLKSLQEKGFKSVIGKSDREMFGEEHFEKSFAAEKEIMSNKKSILDAEERIEISKGVHIWGLTTRVPLMDNEGNVLGTLVITRDISKEKEYAEELEALKSNN